MDARRKFIVGLLLTLAAWFLVGLAVWSPVRGLPALVRGSYRGVLDLLAIVGMFVLTVPLILALGYVAIRRLLLDRREKAKHEKREPPEG